MSITSLLKLHGGHSGHNGHHHQTAPTSQTSPDTHLATISTDVSTGGSDFLTTHAGETDGRYTVLGAGQVDTGDQFMHTYAMFGDRETGGDHAVVVNKHTGQPIEFETTDLSPAQTFRAAFVARHGDPTRQRSHVESRSGKMFLVSTGPKGRFEVAMASPGDIEHAEAKLQELVQGHRIPAPEQDELNPQAPATPKRIVDAIA
ncbi:MAG: hypothetical protein KC474_05685 [Cyanobacteria bacterium HKST-UBA04]|nr:hypothetical protein [Cyanobacteria bacterium HKST-UBA05]MCA9799023.1 hypothetical protein [Cyanobacteria bacterium HKST-UBA04]